MPMMRQRTAPLRFAGQQSFDRFATAHAMLDYRNGLQAKDERVWAPFHFLPSGEGQTIEQQRVCRPNSTPARLLRQHALNAHKTNPSDNDLHRLGVRLDQDQRACRFPCAFSFGRRSVQAAGYDWQTGRLSSPRWGTPSCRNIISRAARKRGRSPAASKWGGVGIIPSVSGDVVGREWGPCSRRLIKP